MVGEKIVPRGFLKSYIIKLLRSSPKHGYDIIKLIESETGWKPSPGGIYPILHDLEKRGLVIKFKEGKRKYYKLTKEGKKLSGDFDRSLDEMKEKFQNFVGVMGQILDIKEPELREMIDSHMKSEKKIMFMLSPTSRRSLHKSRKLIFEIAQDKSKHKKLEEVLREINKKLERIASEKND